MNKFYEKVNEQSIDEMLRVMNEEARTGSSSTLENMRAAYALLQTDRVQMVVRGLTQALLLAPPEMVVGMAIVSAMECGYRMALAEATKDWLGSTLGNAVVSEEEMETLRRENRGL